MNTLKYKGYVGSVAYSEPDKVFFGKIEGIDGLVNYEGESVAELTAAFREAVDDYLIFCEEHNLKPEKSYNGIFNVRISPTTHREIANRATEAGISINAFVKNALDAAVQETAHTFNRLAGYDSQAPEPAMLMEPESPAYGKNKDGKGSKITLQVPDSDIALLRQFAARMGWKMM